MVQGLIFGVLAIFKAPLLSSKTTHFIDFLYLGIFITVLTSLKKYITGIASLKAVNRAIYSALVVERAILVYNFDFQIIRHPAYLIMKLVLEYADAGSSDVDLSKLPAKSASVNTSNPFSISGLYINSLSLE